MRDFTIAVAFYPPGQKVVTAGDQVLFLIGLGTDVEGAFFSEELRTEHDLDGKTLEANLVWQQGSLGQGRKEFRSGLGAAWMFPCSFQEEGEVQPKLRLLLKEPNRTWEEGGEVLGDFVLEPIEIQPATRLFAGLPALETLESALDSSLDNVGEEVSPGIEDTGEMAAEDKPYREWELTITSTESKHTLLGDWAKSWTYRSPADLGLSQVKLLSILEEKLKKLDKASRNYEKYFGAKAPALGPAELRRVRIEQTQALAQIGWELYDEVLLGGLTPDADNPRVKLLNDLRDEDKTEEGTLIRIKNQRLALPWSLLYDREPVSAEKFAEEDLTGFWGHRFRIEEVLQVEVDTRRFPPPNPQLCAWIDPTLGVKSRRSDSKSVLTEIAEQHRRDFESSAQYVAQHCKIDVLPNPKESVEQAGFEASSHIVETIVSGSPSDLIYFFCHGRGPTSFKAGLMRGEPAALLLTKGPNDVLVPQSLKRWRAIQTKRAAFPEPVVFLNCCESAMLDPFSVGNLIRGFFDTLRAQAVIGCSWEVPGRFAHEFAHQFYDDLLMNSRTIADTLFRLRRRYLEEFNPFGLLYAVYGNSSLKVLPAEASVVAPVLASEAGTPEELGR